MKTQLFDYVLPDELIARRPPAMRSAGRLLVLAEPLVHSRVDEFPRLLPDGALVVFNNTKVRRARVFGAREPNGGAVELLFLERAPQTGSVERERWHAVGKASKPLRPGTRIVAGELEIEVLQRDESGELEIAVQSGGDSVEAVLERVGRVPIPPYLNRADDAEDIERYQTVYARRTASAAAPTAGLHFTRELLDRMKGRGAELGSLELVVGLGTFRPVKAEDLDEHPMHAEEFEISPELAAAVERARARGGPIVAVGTTVVRALESAADPARLGMIRPIHASTRLLIQPGYQFRIVDALFTNFHQPRSTLLALVSAFAGYERVKAAYEEAVRERYRFLSYGDALWIPQRAS